VSPSDNARSRAHRRGNAACTDQPGEQQGEDETKPGGADHHSNGSGGCGLGLGGGGPEQADRGPVELDSERVYCIEGSDTGAQSRKHRIMVPAPGGLGRLQRRRGRRRRARDPA
jgi:hypothetical protein